MKTKRLAVSLSGVLVLASCGGDGGSSPTPTPPPPPPTSTLTVTLSQSSGDIAIGEGGNARFGFDASYSGTTSGAIVPDISVGGKRYELDGAPTLSGNTYSVKLRTKPFPAGGRTTTNVTFRLCTTTDCSTVYPGSTKTFSVNLDVAFKDWGTFQRDAAHTGFVAVSYNAADFRDGWSFPTGSFPPTETASRRGSVFVNTRTSNGTLTTRALSATDGSNQWSYDLGQQSYASGPSYASGRVASMAMGSSSTSIPLQIIAADDGRALGSVSYSSQFSTGGVPTFFGDNMYFQAGYYGNVVYAKNAADRSSIWTVDTTQPGEGFVHQGESVAVDNDNVYFFGGGNLFALSRTTGAIASKIRNPYFSLFGLSYSGDYRGAPIIAPTGRIITFTDNRGARVPLPLMAFAPASGSVSWRSQRSYFGHPALRRSTLFAARADSPVIDLLNSADGSVTGTITLPSDAGQLFNNIVVTEKHLFVSSESKTFAVDLDQTNYPVVWTAQKGGALAITPDNLLVVSAVDGVYAYRLN